MRFNRLLKKVLLLGALLSSVFAAHGAEITLAKESKTQFSVIIEGPIVEGDFEVFQEIVRKSGPFTSKLYLFSPGGDVREAIKISHLVRELKFETIAPAETGQINRGLNTIEYSEACPSLYGPYSPEAPHNCICASACTIIWASGIERKYGLLRIHRPKIEEQVFAQLDSSSAEQAYNQMSADVDSILLEFGFPESVIQKMKSIPSYRSETYRPLDIPTIVPYFDELLAARCTADPFAGELSVLRNKRLEGHVTETDLARLESIEKSSTEIENCKTIEIVKMRWQSFSKHFSVNYEALVRSGQLYAE